MMFQLADTNTTGAQPTGMANEFQIHLQTWYAQTPVIVAMIMCSVFPIPISTGSIIGIAAVVSPKVTMEHIPCVLQSQMQYQRHTFTIKHSLHKRNYNSQNSQIIYYFTRTDFFTINKLHHVPPNQALKLTE